MLPQSSFSRLSLLQPYHTELGPSRFVKPQVIASLTQLHLKPVFSETFGVIANCSAGERFTVEAHSDSPGLSASLDAAYSQRFI